MIEPIAYLNGRWLAASQATLPVFDAGFVLGATVAEQLRTFNGRLFRPEAHLQRLARSLEIIGVESPMTAADVLAHAQRLIGHNHALLPAGSDLGLTIFVTPGAYSTLAPPDAPSGPTIGMHTYPLPFPHWAEKYARGESLVISSIRQVSSHCWPAELKCRSRM
ncbi:MAG TPA: aminotransferase class IV, partial [Pirellulales bacterium]|nr:aminotransferase class IV [Pirellulales bacterium]